APCAMIDITQTISRERNLPGINIEVVALPGAVCTGKLTLVPLFRRVAAAPDPAYRVLSQAYTSQTRQAPRHRAMTAGTEPILCRVAAAPYPAWGSCDLSFIYSPALLKLPVLAASKSLRRS
ncbi:hypothetical protein SAMN03159308_03651, partial [Klebsiella quasipneumoniae]